MFSQVYLLAEGRTIYFGRPDLVTDYFKSAGFAARPGFSTGDFMLDLVSRFRLDVDGDTIGISTSLEKTVEDKMAQAKSFEDLSGLASGQDAVEYLADYYDEHVGAALAPGDANAKGAQFQPLDTDAIAIEEAMLKDEKWPISWWEQFKALGRRSYIQKRGDFTSGYSLAQVVMLCLIVNAIWWRLPKNDQYTSELSGYLFFTSVFFGFFTLFNALTTFLPELVIIKRERASGLYRLSAYYWSKTMSELLVELSYPTLFTFCTYWSLELAPSGFIPFLVYLWVNVLAASGLGLVVGAWGGSFKAALTTASVTMLAIMLVGGYYVKKENIPAGLEFLNYLSFVTYGYNLLGRTQFGPGSDTRYACTQSMGSVVETCQETGVETYAASDHVDLFALDVSLVNNLLPLLVMMVVFRVLGYLALKFKGAKV